MKDRAARIFPLVAAIVFLALLLDWLRREPRAGLPVTVSAPPPLPVVTGATIRLAAAEILRAVADALSGPDAPVVLQARLENFFSQPRALPNESVLTFRDNAAYQAFLARAAAAGLEVAGRVDGLLSARVRFTTLDGLAGDLLANAGDYLNVAINTVVVPPTAPAPEDRAGGPQVPVGNNLLSELGITGDRSTWGQGITIAVLDSGVAPDPTLGSRLRLLDLGLGTAPAEGDGHATAVASLAAGASPDAAGVAPGADILSIRVTGDGGTSDVFTLAQAIVAATDNGAQIINISMGAYSDAAYLSSAISYAMDHGAVIVSSAGNDQASQLTWPAADPRVVSVGSVDGVGQQDIFSNSSPQLMFTAPGYEVQAAWLDGERVYFTGTSASAPAVAGAIAAMMTQNPGMTATDAYQTLLQYSSDGGRAGTDPDYGVGSLNVGWAMNRNDPARVDTAISSHYYDGDTGNMEFVVQNRSGQAVSGLTLNVDNGSGASVASLPSLQPGETFTATVPVDDALLAAGQLTFRTTLTNPPGVPDAVPANNRAASTLTAPAASP